MDLAQSILNELVTLQKKNEDLIGIIKRLEHESDVIIRQFEDKITDLDKKLKKAQDAAVKAEKKFDLLARENEHDREQLEKEKQELEQTYSQTISELRETIDLHRNDISGKDQQISDLRDQKILFEQQLSEEKAKTAAAIDDLKDISHQQEQLTLEKEQLITEIQALKEEYDGLLPSLREDISRKEKELRALAGELKIRIKNEEKLIKEREKEQKKVAQEISALRETIASNKATIESLHAEHRAESVQLSDTIQHLTAQVSEKEQAIDSLYHDLKQRIETLETEKKSLTEIHDADQALIADLTLIQSKQVDATEKTTSALREREQEVAELHEQLAYLQAEVDTGELRFQDSIRKKDLELSDKNEEISVLNRELNRIKKNFDDRIADREQRIQELGKQISILETTSKKREGAARKEIKALQAQIKTLSDELADVSRKRDQHEQEVAGLHEQLASLRAELDEAATRYQEHVRDKDLELTKKQEEISVLERELRETNERSEERIADREHTIQELGKQIASLELSAKKREETALQEIQAFQDHIQELNNELADAITRKDQREQEYRDEITHLHDDFIQRNEEWKNRTESQERDLAERDRHITLISGNNEALRSELERVRSRLLLLEKTIREDREEPVHALYRQIQNLSAKLAGKESENAVLSSRIIRLDTENTKLSRILAESGLSAGQEGLLETESTHEGKTDSDTASINSIILRQLSHLEDPSLAMDAASEIVRLGTKATNTLIPLLYVGTLQRRAWVAVLLYEINDPKATKPLSDLLESSESGLRELIWDIRLRFREWRRSGSISSVAH